MRHKLSIFLSIALVSMLALAGCSEPEISVQNTSAITISLVGDAQADSFTVNIAPDDLAVGYEYAISTEADSKTFVSGEMAGIVKVDNGDENEVAFDNLQPNTRYFVYARSYDAQGNAGPVAVMSAYTTIEGGFEVEVQYVSDKAMAFAMATSQDYYMFEYCLGKSGDRAKFEDGTIEGLEVRSETFRYTVNYLEGIDPETDYVFYARAYSRKDGKGDVVEIPVTTKALGSVPAVTFSQVGDCFMQELTFTPNAHSDKSIVYFGSEGSANDLIIYSYMGDIAAFVELYVPFETANPATYGEPLTLESLRPELRTDIPMEAFVVSYVEDGINEDKQTIYKVANVQRIAFVNFEYDDTIPAPDPVDITVSDITSVGATYHFAPFTGSTVLMLFDAVEADWWDEFITTDDYYPEYLRDQFFSMGVWYRHTSSTNATHIEINASPNTRYYLVTCPMNANGMSYLGWGEPNFTAEFTTLPE